MSITPLTLLYPSCAPLFGTARPAGQGQNKNLAVRIGSLDEQVVRQQELLYNVEFQLQQVGCVCMPGGCAYACVHIG